MTRKRVDLSRSVDPAQYVPRATYDDAIRIVRGVLAGDAMTSAEARALVGEAAPPGKPSISQVLAVFDRLNGAAQGVETALPRQMSGRVERLERERVAMYDALMQFARDAFKAGVVE